MATFNRNAFAVLILSSTLVPIHTEIPLQFSENVHKIMESNANCLAQMVRQNLKDGSSLCMIQSGNKSTNHNVLKSTLILVLVKIMNDLKLSFIIKQASVDITNEFTTLEKVDNYMIFMKSVIELESVIDMLPKTVSWNPHAKFIIYVDGHVSDYKPLVQIFGDTFWKYFTINLIVVVPGTIETMVFTMFPYSAGNCGKERQTYSQIDSCVYNFGNKSKDEKPPKTVNLFPDKVPFNLHQCSLNISTTAYPPFVIASDIDESKFQDGSVVDVKDGIEIEILKIIVRKANFKPKYRLYTKQMIDQTNNSVNMINDLEEHKADIAIGNINPFEPLHRKFDYSIQYMQDETTWVVPTSHELPKWRNLFLIFQPSVWISSIVSYLMVSLAAWFISIKLYSSFEWAFYRHLEKVMLSLMGMMVASTSPILPKSNGLRSILFMWSLFCLHLMSAYSAGLISKLTTAVYDDQISSINGIISNGFKIGMSKEMALKFDLNRNEKLSPTRPIQSYILKNWEICESLDTCLKLPMLDSKFAIATSRYFFEYSKNSYTDDDGHSILRAFPTNIVTLPVEILLLKGHPLKEKFNVILNGIIEAGLINHHWPHTKHRYFELGKSHKPLRLEHLSGAFMVLGIGLTVALTALVVELMVYVYIID